MLTPDQVQEISTDLVRISILCGALGAVLAHLLLTGIQDFAEWLAQEKGPC